MWVVDPKDRYAVADPMPHDTENFAGQPVRIVVEVQRIDVLVFLRRVFGVGNGSVRKFGEPLPVADCPGVIRCALQCQVEGDLQSTGARGRNERVEILDRAEIGMHGIVSACAASDRPGRADVAGLGGD